MIYTTHFNALRHHTTLPFIPVSIARFKAKYVQVDREYKMLAPSKDLLLGYKDRQISDAEYTVQFLAQLKSSNVETVYARFLSIKQQNKPKTIGETTNDKKGQENAKKLKNSALNQKSQQNKVKNVISDANQDNDEQVLQPPKKKQRLLMSSAPKR